MISAVSCDTCDTARYAIRAIRDLGIEMQGGRCPRGGIEGVPPSNGDVGACSHAFATVAFFLPTQHIIFMMLCVFTRVFVFFQKLSLVFMSPIYPIYDLKTEKDAEFRKEFESAVENAIALRKHDVFKEILLLLQICPIYDPKMRNDAEFHE